jgi:hypothetical protein
MEQFPSEHLTTDLTPEMLKVYHNFPLRNGDFDIRLLVIQAGSKTEEIVCTFVLASLDEKPQYEALSYIWGDNTSKVVIALESDIFPVTRNLENALRHLRRPDEDRVLWVDALCLYLDRYRTKISRKLET